MLFFIFKRLTAILLFLAISLGNSFSSDFSDIPGFETGNTPIIDAVSSKDYKSLEFFVKISPRTVNDQNIGGATALHIAARNNDIKSAQILLLVKADSNIRDLEGYTAPLRACEYKNEKLFAEIASKAKVDFNVKNSDGDGFITISTFAQSYGCLETALNNIIPLRDISVINLKKDLKNAFIIAVAKNDEKSKEILLKYLDNLHSFERTMNDLENREKNVTEVIKNKPLTKSKKKKLESSQIEKNEDDFYVIDNIKKENKKPKAPTRRFILKSGSKGMILEDISKKPNTTRIIDKKKKVKKRYKKVSYFKNKKPRKYSINNRKRTDPGLLIEETIIID